MSKNKIYSNTNLGIYCYLGATFLVIFCLIFQFTVFHHLPQHAIYTVIYIVGLFFLKAKFGKERGQQAFRIGCQRCNVEYANEPQANAIYLHMICVNVLFHEKISIGPKKKQYWLV